MKKLLILGVNGFIGHHLVRRVLATTDWDVTGMDIHVDRVAEFLGSDRFHFQKGDITAEGDWIERKIRDCDVILPLAAIATPATYVKSPLQVFELDFEANLPIVRLTAAHGKRLVFPSTSEVYGMCADAEFDPETSNLVYGPIDKPRWIYACSKQLLERVIAGHGQRDGLRYTLFRPFNWIGPGLDSIHTAEDGSARVISQFLGHIARGEAIKLVDGGRQRRTFCHIDDGIEALTRIIGADDAASGRIYNIGNPANDLSVRELAELMLTVAAAYPEYAGNARRVALLDTPADEYYGDGYQDVMARVPRIVNTMTDLGWSPRVTMRAALASLFDFYRDQVPLAGERAAD